MSAKTLDAWVQEDQRIEEAAQSKTLALMEHRWKAIHKGGFGVREYARAVGKSAPQVTRYVQAWDLWSEWTVSGTANTRTPMDAYTLANMSEVQREAAQIVATAKGVAVQTAEKNYRPDIQRAREVIEAEPDRAAGVAKAKERAEKVERMRDRENERDAERAASKPRAYLDVEFELGKARRALQNAVNRARAASFDEEMVELLVDSRDRVMQLGDLFGRVITSVMIGEEIDLSEVDWDAELAAILGAES